MDPLSRLLLGWKLTPAAAMLVRHDSILRASIEGHHGYVVKQTGDGVYAVFAEATDAVTAATDTVRAFLSEEWGATGPLRAPLPGHAAALLHRLVGGPGAFTTLAELQGALQVAREKPAEVSRPR